MKLFMQQWNDELSKERNQIVFENRNRAYGAYELRQSYNDNMIKALFGGLLFFGLILLIPAFHGGYQKEIPVIECDFGRDLVLQEYKFIPKTESSAHSTAKVEKVADKLNVKVSDKEDNRDKLDEITNRPIETMTTENHGNPYSGLNEGTGVDKEVKPGGQQDPIEKKEVVKPAEEANFVTWAPVMPLFPGGDDARKKFFSKNMTYPRIPLENGIEGTVIVNFIVGKNGEINDIKIVKSINKELDKEAIRVISLMPNWAPGMNNGKPVKVSFNLPVKFVIPN
ncbi:MAG: energy transducer TonB [Bacteroidetes bacterium]|nr:energy transducer TonB [Bacteroidota bacterium]